MAEAKKKTVKKKAAGPVTARADKKCSVSGCKRVYRAKSYCRIHYKKWRRGELGGHTRYNICSKEGCRKPTEIGGECREHWNADHKKGEAAAAAA